MLCSVDPRSACQEEWMATWRSLVRFDNTYMIFPSWGVFMLWNYSDNMIEKNVPFDNYGSV